MTFPTIPTAGDGRVLTVNQTDSSAARTFPDLSNLTKNSGDLLIAIIVAYQSSTTNAQFGSWGGGFTEIHDSGTSTTLAVGVAYKWSTGSETGTFTVTQEGTITGDAAMILLSIPGAHPTTPPENSARVSGTTAAANPPALSPSWGAEDTLWITVFGSGMTATGGSWVATGSTPPTNYSNWVDTNATDTSTIGDTEAAVAFRQRNAATEDPPAALGIDISNARGAALVIAVRPAPVEVTHPLAATTAIVSTAYGAPKALLGIAATTPVVSSAYGALSLVQDLGMFKVRIGGQWLKAPAKVNHLGSWVQVPVKTWSGSAWVP